MLLDEPTNHLDVASLEWLENELTTLDAGIILVAHDRWFLEATTTAVLELEAGRSTYFAGPWHQWRIEKASRLQAASKEAARYAEDIARLERFVARFRYKKTKAKPHHQKLKEIRVRPKTGVHDIETKVNQARKFLEHKDKVLVNVLFRGRELQHIDEGRRIITGILEKLQDLAKVEKAPSMEGKRMTAMLAPRA